MKKTLAALIVLLAAFPAFAGGAVYQSIPEDPNAIVVNQELKFPCWYCLAIVSRGGGRPGATSAIMDLHVISNPDDQAFPRALVARIESWCQTCQPTALTAQARGLGPETTVWAANLEAYSQGRATVAELNMGAGAGGYVFDVVPTRLPDGQPSKIDAILKVEGFGYDPGAAKISAVVDIKINPTRAVTIIPANQGPVTVMETSDGRMKEVWAQNSDGLWTRQILVDGAQIGDDPRIVMLEQKIEALTRTLAHFGISP